MPVHYFPLAVVGRYFHNWTKKLEAKCIIGAFLVMEGIALGSLLSFRYVPTKYLVGEALFDYMLGDNPSMLTTYI